MVCGHNSYNCGFLFLLNFSDSRNGEMNLEEKWIKLTMMLVQKWLIACWILKQLNIFNNEKFEFNRLDKSLEEYELAANQSRHSLSLLNVAQTFIIMTGITIMLVMSAYGIKNGDIDVGGFVVINAYMLQLYQPLNWLGSVYRELDKH